MKKILPLFLFSILIQFQINGQGIFDTSIHTAIPIGDVNSPFTEGPQQIIDQDPATKYLDFNIGDGMAFEVDLLGVPKTASSIQIVTANDAPERDPTMYEILGSTDSITFTSITIGELPCASERFLSRTFGFTNTTSYTYYQIIFTGTCGTSTINQVADVQLFETIGNPPTIECPTEIVIGNSVGECGGIATFDIIANDVEDGMLTPTITSGLPSGSLFPLGTSSVVFSVTDSDNNTVSCNLTVTVQDSENPTVDCPSDITITGVDPGGPGIEVTYDLFVSDNCSVINPLPGFTSLGSIDGRAYYLSDSLFTAPEAFVDATLQGGMVGRILNEDENTYLLNAILRNNNGVAGILFGLTDLLYENIFLWSDGFEPTYTNWNMGEPNNSGVGGAPENYTIILTSGLWNDVDTTVARRYLLELAYVPLQTQGLASGSIFPIGTTTNTYMIYDAAGNTTTCEFDVIVDDQVSVEDQILTNGIKIFPNPTHNLITVNNFSNIPLEQVSIHNLQGKMITSYKIQSSLENQTIDITQLNSGMYFLKIKGKEGIATKKIIKL